MESAVILKSAEPDWDYLTLDPRRGYLSSVGAVTEALVGGVQSLTGWIKFAEVLELKLLLSLLKTAVMV